jgi:2-phosphoglycerate kinase
MVNMRMTKRQRDYKKGIVESLINAHGIDKDYAKELASKVDDRLIHEPECMNHIPPYNMAQEIWKSIGSYRCLLGDPELGDNYYWCICNPD